MTDIQFKGVVNGGFGHTGNYMTAVDRKKQVTEFRRTHFIMGKHPSTLYSNARFEMQGRSGLMGGRKDTGASKFKNQSTNF